MRIRESRVDQGSLGPLDLLQTPRRCTAGIVGNSFSLVVFLVSRALRARLTNWYLVNQSGLDCAVSLFLMLTTATVRDSRVGSGLAAEMHCRCVGRGPVHAGLVKS